MVTRGATAAAWAVAVIAVTAAVMPQPATAYTYTFSRTLTTVRNSLLFSEGPMWAPADDPYNTGGDSYISATWSTVSKQTVVRPLGKLSIMYLSGADVLQYVGGQHEVDPASEEITWDLCCTTELLVDGTCDNLHVPIVAADAPADAVTTFTVDVEAEAANGPSRAVATLASKYNVTSSGDMRVLVVLCGSAGNITETAITGDVSFRNPYGYVPGMLYAYPAFYGVATGAYLVLLVWYLVVYMRNRSFLLAMQRWVLVILFVSFVEAVVTFGSYMYMNDSGRPPCCPAPADVVVRVLLNVVKKALSRWLLLAVCLGYGVVHQHLDRRTHMYMAGLTVLYVVLALVLELETATSRTVTRSAWDLPVYLVDCVFLFTTYASLAHTRRTLQTNQQQVKLEMYDSLANTLAVFVFLWLLSSVAIMSTLTVVDLVWRLQWIVLSVWDVIYFLLLLVIAVLWRPSESSYQYAWYAQPSSDDLDDSVVAADFDGAASGAGGGGGSGGGGGGGRRAAPSGHDNAGDVEMAGIAPAAHFRIGDSDSDDDAGFGGVTAVAPSAVDASPPSQSSAAAARGASGAAVHRGDDDDDDDDDDDAASDGAHADVGAQVGLASAMAGPHTDKLQLDLGDDDGDDEVTLDFTKMAKRD